MLGPQPAAPARTGPARQPPAASRSHGAERAGRRESTPTPPHQGEARQPSPGGREALHSISRPLLLGDAVRSHLHHGRQFVSPVARECPALRRPTSCLCAGGPARRGLSVRRTTPLVGPSNRATVDHATCGVVANRGSGVESGLRGGTASAARPTASKARPAHRGTSLIAPAGGEPTEGGPRSQGREAVSLLAVAVAVVVPPLLCHPPGPKLRGEQGASVHRSGELAALLLMAGGLRPEEAASGRRRGGVT
jgi:hypothetical protein